MEDRVVRLESRIAHLTDRISDLEQRLSVLEGRTPAPIREAAADDGLAAIVGFDRTPVQQWLGLAGRTLVVLGGAYLLRALTGSHVVPAEAGVALGLLYGAPWLLLASRAAARGAQIDAFAHALTAALIGYPLVWEATLRFNVVSPAQSAALLGALTAAALLLSSTRTLEGLAWVVSFGALISASGLAIVTGSWTAYTILAIGVGVATLWLGYIKDWTVLRWPAAAVANGMLLILTARVAGTAQISAVLVVQMLMLGAYLGSFAIRTLLIGRPVIPFEVVQSVGVLTVAFGGAIYLIRSSGSNVVMVGIASLVLAILGYVVAFAFVERHRHVKNFFFYALMAQLFAIVGVALCAGTSTGSVVYSAACVVCAALAHRNGRLTLALQTTVYAIAAALASGLVNTAAIALLFPPSAWTAASLSQLVALTAVAIATFLPIRRAFESWRILASIPRLVLIVTLVCTAVGLAITEAVTLLLDVEHIDDSVLATIRTAVLVAATLALAASARYPAGREAAWLVYPLILVTGAKLVLADFPQGRPETLFAALALYGFALIAAPRMLRRTPPVSTAVSFSRIESAEPSVSTTAATAGGGRK